MRSEGKPKDEPTDHKEKLDAAESYQSRLGKPVGIGRSSTIERRLPCKVSVQVKQDDHADGCEAQAVHLRDKAPGTGFAGNMSQESAGDGFASGNRKRDRAFFEANRIGPSCIHIQNRGLESRSNIVSH